MKYILSLIIVIFAATVFIISIPFQMISEGSKALIENCRKVGHLITG